MQLDEATTPARACRALWLSVIAAVAEDSDWQWFDLKNADFRFVCWLADVAPEWVAAKIQHMAQGPARASRMARGTVWTTEARERHSERVREAHARRREAMAVA